MAKIFTFILLTSFFGQSASRLDLKSLCQDMWDQTGENLNVPLELRFNSEKSKDKPLFELTAVGKAKIVHSEVFDTFKELLSDPEDTSLQDDFFDAIMTAYGPMQVAYKYLKANNLITKAVTKERFECMLRDIWFARPGKGFLHVFAGDRQENSFQGLHNWYQFFLEQEKKKIVIEEKDLKRIQFSYNTEPNFIKNLDFTWDLLQNFAMSGTSMFVGTSPAFEFALFSVCFLAQKGIEKKVCTCNIHNSQLDLRVIENTHHGKVRTAYPASVKADAICKGDGFPRTNCGYYMINHYNCAKRGCCFDSNPDYKTWCFYPSNHKCHGIYPKHRKPCGYKFIDWEACEELGCCYDRSIPGVPDCFHGKSSTVNKGQGILGKPWNI